jgi:hypothetical protein
MKRTITILIVGLITVMLSGCTQPSGGANTASTNRAATANTAAAANIAVTENRNSSAATGNSSSTPASANANANTSSAGTAPVDSSKLLGTYHLNQIQKEGVATMMSVADIELVFNADNRYSRAVTAKGKTVQTESGQFIIEGDKLTFNIILSGKTINKTPIRKEYTIALSPDGRELKLTSKTGETAVFYRAQ